MAAPDSTERFDGYEAEFRLVSADLSQKLDQIREQSGDARAATVSQATSLLDEARELITSMKMEKAGIPSATRPAVSARLRNHESDLDGVARGLAGVSSERAALFGARYRDEPEGEAGTEQRQQLLSGTERLNRSSGRIRESQRIANETEAIGAGTLSDLARQRQTIEHTREVLGESEGYADRSIKTLRGMARRYGISFVAC